MSMNAEPPDPEMKVVSVASGLSLVEAHLLAGRLQAEGIRAAVSPGGSEMGPWAAIPVLIAPGFTALLPGNPLGRGGAEVLVVEDDLEEAKRIVSTVRDS